MPLHVGCLTRRGNSRGAFVEFFGTHGPNKGVFLQAVYDDYRAALGMPEVKDDAASNAAADARASREAELAAVRRERSGGGGQQPQPQPQPQQQQRQQQPQQGASSGGGVHHEGIAAIAARFGLDANPHP